VAARGCTFKGENVWLLRKRWGIATVKINGVSANPPHWPDGTYSIQGADSDGSRPGFRDDLAHHSDLMSLGVPI
jgi:hypothetical protein